MPAYNSAETIAESIESVLAQTFSHWELIVVDDGSTDETWEIATGYASRDPRIRVLRVEHGGCGAARGAGASIARAPYIARLDSDDLYLPEYMAEFAEFIEAHPGHGIYSCNGERFHPDGSAMLRLRGPRFERVVSVDLDEMLAWNRVFTTAVFDRSILDLVGGIRSDIYVEDYDLWIRALAHGATHIYLPKVLARYRVSEGQMTSDRMRIEASAIQARNDLIASGSLSRRQIAIARAKNRDMRRWIAARRWADLERRVAAGDRTHLLRDAFRARQAIPDAAEVRARALVAESIRRLRRVFPVLENVRLRKRSRAAGK
ncbi:glycosyltransferase family 2 protein [Anaerosoma tenue]|uniref:glycosyltransferase family 2 protein n=1 Tax=Anaerosoma tenue TaxID=2933588 RepID=UPI0022608E2F|nr:glycosyltransferase [Anaerosoma tenue]MCK8114695.1 glycosyltransferase [Anaerosoma tenue]